VLVPSEYGDGFGMGLVDGGKGFMGDGKGVVEEGVGSIS